MTQAHEQAAPSAVASEPLVLLTAALERWDEDALRHQRLRQPLVLFAVALGPVAVLLLAIQALALPGGGWIATSLIALELAVLLMALWFGLLAVGRATHNRWLRSRLRAEVLRRERFLFRARVGPYLNLADDAAAAQVARRLVVLDSDGHNPVDLLPLGDTRGSWRDMFEDGSHRAAPPLADGPETARAYLAERVADQRRYFMGKAEEHRHRSELFENAAKITLTLAFLVAALHLGLLLTDQGDTPHAIHGLLVIAAVTLPAIGSGFAALQSAAGSLRLSRSCTYYAGALEPLEQSLLEVTQALAGGSSSAVPERRFRRAVLSVEQLLSDELRQWWTIMAPTGPRAGA